MTSISLESKPLRLAIATLAGVLTLLVAGHAQAQTYRGSALGYAAEDDMNDTVAVTPDDSALPARFQRTIVSLDAREAPGTIIIDTRNTYLYLVLGSGRAMRYGVGVGREGFSWTGVQSVSRKAEWPDWIPPASMIARQPYLPRFTSGGPGNPLGARAMYLGGTEYRIHGTNDPSTIGKFVSSGCIRLTNDDVIDLYGRVQVGAKVVVLPVSGPRTIDTVATLHGSASSHSASLRGVERRAQTSLTAIN